jgi:hypothetical protein
MKSRKGVTYYDGIQSMSGKSKHGDFVHVTDKASNKSYIRGFVKPKITEHNHQAGSKFKAMSNLWKILPEPFKEDCRLYAKAYNRQCLMEEKHSLNARHVFAMAVCKHNEPINTIEQLINTLGNSITDWIARGYLQKINEGINLNFEGINEGINLDLKKEHKQLLLIIANNPMIKQAQLIYLTDKSHATIERYLKVLKDKKLIEYKDSNKTGGYITTLSKL